MLKQLLVFGLALCMFTLVGFKYMQKTPPVVPGKKAPVAFMLLSKPATLMPGSVPVTVEFEFQSTGNVILATRVYLSTDPCVQCLVSSVTGGPINYAGGAWRTVDPVVVTCSSGTVSVSGPLNNFGTLCDLD